ncbi:probable serine protease EDA2 isoform X1 [Salvia splendens]|uniref:probable serine protease EDA2 isoform X1 n=2 Tax=Salvia splendens TaxID=180675 RepID=UPI001C27F9FF|nr:probable serine protease EDA2 isoform X1 [Salvia splendens]
MKKLAAAISIAILAVASASALRHMRETSYLSKEEHWINQTIDHFSPYDRTQFAQRYYEYLHEFHSPDAPIFLIICGESSCNGISNDYLGVLAKKFGAAVVSLEHRYYGKSYPFGSFSMDNLRYLSSKQALFDLAVFRQYYQESLNAKLNKSTHNPWFVFGISYAGALSAWFRLKFPHLTCGSLASSALVLAVYNFTKFDQQVGESAGPECKAVLQEITNLVEQRLESNQKELKKLFNASKLSNDGDFLYFLADAAVTAIQYGDPDELCNPLTEAKKAGEDLVEAYAKYVKEYYIDYIGVDVEAYGQQQLKRAKISDSSSARLWWFQVCTEVAYFRVAPANDSIRSSKVDTRYYLDLCKKVFGNNMPGPDVNATNLYYGGKDIAGSKIIFTNGSQDPWRHASKQTSSRGMPAYIIKCHNCGHGADMRGCPQSRLVPKGMLCGLGSRIWSCSSTAISLVSFSHSKVLPVVFRVSGDAKNCASPDAVNKVRRDIITHIYQWLSECQFSGVSAM